MKKYFFFAICAMTVLLTACEQNAPTTSSNVETDTASDITRVSAILHGKVHEPIFLYDFGMMVSDNKADLNAREGKMYKAKTWLDKDFAVKISRLSPETKYYYCAWALLNNKQYEFGSIKEFTTLEVPEHDGIGMFSVGKGKIVTFSKGNLQYTQSTDTWSFADNQWDMIGTDNVTGGDVSSDQIGENKEGTALADKVDLFGWSTNSTYFGVSASLDQNDYSGSFVDWGTNQIGTDSPNTWRTLTYDEWNYLIYTRADAIELSGVAQVNGVNGLILLPDADAWTCPEDVTFTPGCHSSYGVDYYAAYQTFTADQWSKLEAAGAVFLPASGYRNGQNVGGVQYVGSYWSATELYGDGAHCLGSYSSGPVYSGGAGMYYDYRDNGRSVRLVQDLP
jgi:hypothetical protein